MIGLNSCETGDKRPALDLPIYGAAVEYHGIIRKQDFIGCYEPKFNDYICIHVDQIKVIDQYLNRCEKWK